MRAAAALARQVRRRLRRPARRPAVILLYHRVARVEVDPWGIAVTPSHFEEHLDVLRRLARPAPLQRLLSETRARQVTPGTVVVTFDDGYADNLYAAVPLLERHDVPGTVFVTGAALGSGGEFWWDTLARHLLHRLSIPEPLVLRLAGRTREWDLSDSSAADPLWRAGVPPPGPREAAFLDVWSELSGLGGEERDRAVAAVAAWSAAPPPSRDDGRSLTVAEMRPLAESALMEIGAHTLTHPRLSALNACGQRREIEGCRAGLEAVLGRPVTSFSYPFGRPGDFSDATVRLVRDLGFACACVNTGGGVAAGADLWRLPRLYVRDCDGDAFAAMLSQRIRFSLY